MCNEISLYIHKTVFSPKKKPNVINSFHLLRANTHIFHKLIGATQQNDHIIYETLSEL